MIAQVIIQAGKTPHNDCGSQNDLPIDILDKNRDQNKDCCSQGKPGRAILPEQMEIRFGMGQSFPDLLQITQRKEILSKNLPSFRQYYLRFCNIACQ